MENAFKKVSEVKQTLKNYETQVASAHNMVEIQGLLGSVAQDYQCLFAQTERPFNCDKETQEAWLTAVNVKYGSAIKAEQFRLLLLVPERMHRATMYLDELARFNLLLA